MELAELTADRGTLDFKIDSYHLFEGENVYIASVGIVGIRIYRIDDTLCFDRMEPATGTRSVAVDISGFDKYDRFRVFATWSPDDMSIHIGPHPSIDGELRHS